MSQCKATILGGDTWSPRRVACSKPARSGSEFCAIHGKPEGTPRPLYLVQAWADSIGKDGEFVAETNAMFIRANGERVKKNQQQVKYFAAAKEAKLSLLVRLRGEVAKHEAEANTAKLAIERIERELEADDEHQS